MKKIKGFSIITILSALLSIICLFCACGDGSTLTYSEYKYEVNGEIIAEGYSVKAANTNISGEIEIPSTYKGKPVIAIANNGFNKCTKITTLTIPEGVVYIGTDACQCANATVNLPSTIKAIMCSASQTNTPPKIINYNGSYADWKEIRMPIACYSNKTIVHLTNGDIINNIFTAM